MCTCPVLTDTYQYQLDNDDDLLELAEAEVLSAFDDGDMAEEANDFIESLSTTALNELKSFFQNLVHSGLKNEPNVSTPNHEDCPTYYFELEELRKELISERKNIILEKRADIVQEMKSEARHWSY